MNEISNAAIERMQDLHDLGLDINQIARSTQFPLPVVRACLDVDVSSKTANLNRESMRAKLLRDNPHHTPETLAPIFRRLRR